MPDVLVSDANIFIDFRAGGILAELFELSDDIVVPDALYRDELAAQHSDLLQLDLQQRTLGGEAVLRIVQLAQTYTRPSRYDLMALGLAEQESCTLLTGDSDLRDAAKTEGVSVHGTLWLCGRLVQDGVLTADEAASAYNHMKAGARFLPWKLVRNQLKGWGCTISSNL
jgi:predicted nucleic acid-binding protein